MDPSEMGERKMKRAKKGLNLSRLLVITLVVLFGSSAFAMQQLQWSPLRAVDSDLPLVSEPVVSEPQKQEANVTNAGILPVAKAVSQDVTEEPKAEEQQDEKKEADSKPAQENKSSVASAPRQQSAAPAPKVDKPVKTKQAEALKPQPEPEQAKHAEADKPAAVAETETEPEEKVEEKTTPANPYRVLSTRDHNMLTKLVVKNTGDEISQNVRIEVPLVTTNSLYFSRRGEQFSLVPEVTTVNGTRVGVFTLGDMEPGEETVVEIKTQARTSNVQFFADYVPTDGKTITSYLGTASGIETTNSQIVSLSNQITSGMSTDWDKARAITRWVATNITYDASAANRNSGALAALQSRRGVCEDYAKLCAALGRAANIPTRVVYGYTDSGSKWPSSGSFSLSGYRHAWVEHYLYGRGWVPAEPTRSNSSTLYFGTLPHNRYIIQNYNNMSLSGKYSGGKLSISWADSLY
jgi:outer membrane biosynthesis protein TonB